VYRVCLADKTMVPLIRINPVAGRVSLRVIVRRARTLEVPAFRTPGFPVSGAKQEPCVRLSLRKPHEVHSTPTNFTGNPGQTP
jgi:hypothetical protein